MAGPMTALDIGAWVTGYTSSRLFGFTGHEGHLFKLESRAVDTPISNAGFVQDVRCLVCGEYIPRVDGEFLQEQVSQEDIQACLDRVSAARRQLYRAKRILQNELVKGLGDGS